MNISIGERFGRLVSKNYVSGSRKIKSGWMCVCDCGTEHFVVTNKLISGHTKSCGCIVSENGHILGLSRKTHGRARANDPTYKAWSSAKYRCSKNSAKYKSRYYDRGIIVCDRWINSFESFYVDMGDKPEGLSLDRKDNDGNYDPTNCRWATDKQQQRNRTNTRYLIIDGDKIPLMEIADKLNIKKSAAQYFWSVLNTLTEEYGTNSFTTEKG